MGGKSSAPDYSAAAAASEHAAQVSQDQLDFAKQVYKENKPASDASTAASLEYQKQQIETGKTLTANAAEDRARYKSTFQPMEDAQAAEAKTAGGAADQQAQAALAKGDIATGLANQRAASNRAMMSMGVNPNSSRFAATANSDNIALAAAEGSAMTRARQAAKNLGWTKKMDAISIGKGLPGQQTTALQAASGIGLNGTSAATAALNAQTNQTAGITNAASGLASTLNGQASTLSSQANAQAQANAAESAGFGQLVGTGITATAMVM